MRLGVEYRAKFGKDFLIDLVGYRRHGHNETDEPAFTQPAMYAQIEIASFAARGVGQRLVAEGVITTKRSRRSTPRSRRFRADSERRIASDGGCIAEDRS